MPFDSTGALPQLAPAFEMPEFGDIARSADADENAKRRVAIQRVINYAAVTLFCALGALAGAGLVILMLVALIIPATMAFTLSTAVAVAAAIFALVWFKRRAGKDARHSLAVAAA